MSSTAHEPAFSRQAEENRILANTLRRLQECLGQDQDFAYRAGLLHAGISDSDIDDNHNLSHEKLGRVLRHIREKIPGITVHLFSKLSLLDLGMIGYAGASSGTVGKAIDILMRYHELTTDRFDDIIEVEGDTVVLRPVPYMAHMGDFQDVIEDSLAGNWNLLTQLLGNEVDFSEAKISFAFAPPSYSELYRQAFCCAHEFDQERSEIRFPAHWLEMPVATANWAMSDVCNVMCERILGPGEPITNTTHSVRQLLLSRPGRRMLRLEEAAESLRLSTAQLRKRLYRADTSYKQIVLEVRMTLARQYLEATRISIQEIAYLLDYSQPGPFSRAFKAYYGFPPIHCREQALAD
jgi:AraC-like DNA-binding protein